MRQFSVVLLTTFLLSCSRDRDGDGFAEDCNDEDPLVFPGAEEACDDVDNDCDGEIDEAGGAESFADSDADGFGDSATAAFECEAPTTNVANADDCDDTDAAVHPGAFEQCNGTDDDCDNSVDEGFPANVYYMDSDADGYGDSNQAVSFCSQPDDYVAQGGDCNDMNASVNPGVPESCGTLEDEDCDGRSDPYEPVGPDSPDALYMCVDLDFDGIGSPETAIWTCATPDDGQNWALQYCNDCDEVDPEIPRIEACANGIDDDCDGAADDLDDECPT